MEDEGQGQAQQESTDARFARNFRQRRESLDLSQADVAEQMTKAGMPYHQQTVAKIENNTRAVRLNEALKLASIVGVSVLDLTLPSMESRHGMMLRHLTGKTATTHTRVIRALEDLMDAREQLRASILAAEQLIGAQREIDPESMKDPIQNGKETLERTNPERTVARVQAPAYTSGFYEQRGGGTA